MSEDFDVVIVGSGFGGSVAALPDLVVMPVYRGGELWRASLESWGSLILRIPRILISINGIESDRDLEVLAHSKLANHENLELLVTGVNLTAPEHIGYLVSQSIFLQDPEVKSVMLWAHDDLCSPQTLLSHMMLVDRDTAIFGKWVHSRAVRPKGPWRRVRAFMSRASLNSRDSVMMSLNDIESLGQATSVSGVVTSRQAFMEFGDWIKLTARGGRAEYMLVSHRTVKSLMIAEVPYVQITSHPYQESEVGSKRDWWFDEGVYQAWLVRQNRVRGWTVWLFVVIKLFRAMTVRPVKFFRLMGFLRSTNGNKF